MSRTTEAVILNATAMILMLATAFVTPLLGQAVASAQISGVVTDPRGAQVPAAKVTATQIDTGLIRTTQSGPDGTYVLPDLPVGHYTLQVQAKGFDSYVQTGIILQVSDKATINVTLRLGQITQSVQVAADVSMVKTQTSSVSQVMDQQRIVNLPLNGRQATQLIMLSGAANDVGPANGSNFNDLVGSKDYFSADDISVAGGQADGTNYLLDGGENTDDFSNVNLPFPFPDAIQEFSVQTSALSARYGMHPGAVVNAVIKSGTNQFHGDLFEFVRNGVFNARDFFAATQDTLKRNQFGGTIGGPIKKDKLFGFFGYQGTRVRTAPPSFISFVPTQAVLNGDFSQLESPACQASGAARTIVNPATGQSFANDFVPPAMFNQVALNLLSHVPVSSNPCGQLTYAIPEPQREDQYIGRADWNQSAKHSLFAHYFYSDYGRPGQYSNSNVLLANQSAVLDRSQSVVLGDTYTFSPTTLNSAHIGYTRLGITRGPSPRMINLNDVGATIYQPFPNYLNLIINGYLSFNSGSPATLRQNNFQFADDLDLIRGRHHFSFGGEWIRYRFDSVGASLGNGAFTFNGQFSNDALLDFMLGMPNTFSQGNTQYSDIRQNYAGAYVGDVVQLNRKLTVHLGVRWEPYMPGREVDNRMNHFDPAAFAAGQQSKVFVNAPPGLFFPGDPGIPRTFADNRPWDFEPRAGLAWDPTGSGRQVIRAGYGLLYDTMAAGYWTDQTADSPWGTGISVPSPIGGLSNPYLGYPGGNPFPSPNPPSRNQAFPVGGSYFTYPIHAHPTYTDVWNLSYELQLRKDWLVSATYLGNKTSHIYTGADINAGIYIPGMCGASPCSNTSNTNQRRPLYLENPVAGSLYSSIWLADDGANAEYNALLLKTQHRFSHHYTILANYTYSHCISEADFEGDLGGALTQNPNNRNGERGNCGFDIRHSFNLTFVAETPQFANRWANHLLGNWQLAPIISARSGTWFAPLTGLDNSLTGIGNDRPDVTGANPYERNTSTRQWLNAAAFAPNALGTFGDAGSDSLVGPSYFDIDAALSRYFTIKEKQRLELRFEFFNLTNQVNFQNPDNNLQDSTYGVILSDVAPRILQFAVRYTF